MAPGVRTAMFCLIASEIASEAFDPVPSSRRDHLKAPLRGRPEGVSPGFRPHLQS